MLQVGILEVISQRDHSRACTGLLNSELGVQQQCDLLWLGPLACCSKLQIKHFEFEKNGSGWNPRDDKQIFYSSVIINHQQTARPHSHLHPKHCLSYTHIGYARKRGIIGKVYVKWYVKHRRRHQFWALNSSERSLVQLSINPDQTMGTLSCPGKPSPAIFVATERCWGMLILAKSCS